MAYSGMCPRCGGARFDGVCGLCRFDGPGRGSKYVEEIPAGETLAATVTFFNRCEGRVPRFVVALELPQGRIEGCSGISFAGAMRDFARVFSQQVPGMVRALPSNEVVCTGLRFLDLDVLLGRGGEHA